MYERRTDTSNPRGVTHRVSATSLAAQRGESTGPALYKYSPYAPVIRALVFRYNRRAAVLSGNVANRSDRAAPPFPSD